MRTYRPLNVQLDPKLWEALDRAAELGGMTKKAALEAMIANSAGQPWKGAEVIKSAWSKYRRQGWWQSDRERVSQ